ncbi:MAG: hypothetical protein IJH71_01610 [Eubacterium sp.]|nr:hypothetical protein [Eubacterium sp.]
MTFDIRISIKKRYIIAALLLSMYSAFGISLNLFRRAGKGIYNRFAVKSNWARLYAVIMTSQKHPRVSTIVFGVVALFVFSLLIYVFSHRYKVKEIIAAGLFAFFYAFSQWLDYVFRFNETWDLYLGNIYLKIKTFLCISSWSILVFAVVLTLTDVVKTRFSDCSVSSPETAQKGKGHLNPNLKAFLLAFVVILICWLPYCIMFWPGIVHADVSAQLLQYYHYPQYFQGRWVTDGVNVLYSNDHPFLLTIIIGKCMDLSIATGNSCLGVFLLSSIQVFLFAAEYAALIASLRYFGVNRTLVRIALAIYALVPVFPMYALMIGGDPFLAVFYLLFVITILWIFNTKGRILRSKPFLLLEFFSVLMMGIAKNQGIYIAFVMILIVFILFRQYWKQLVICMILPVLVFYIGYQGFIFKAFHVGSVGKQEALSFCFQQTARYVKECGDEVTEEEKQAIDAILDYDKLAERYDRELADPVKKTYHEDATSGDLARYFKVWFSMGLKHPALYLEATMANTWKYFCPGYSNATIYQHTLFCVRQYVGDCSSLYRGIVSEKFLDNMDFDISKERVAARELYYHYLLFSKYIPIFNWMIIPGSVTWLMLTGYLIMWLRKNYRMILMYLPAFLVFGICLLSPKNGNARYLFPAYTIVPALLCTALGGRREKTGE